jgi:hypothetical protein
MAKTAAKKPAKKTERISYNDKLADRICVRIVEGESIRKICADPSMPGMTAVFSWLNQHEYFAKQYARAKEEQAEKFADEIVEIADETPEIEPVLDKNGEVVEMKISSAYVSWQKNRVDARKWIASKLKPKKYGDKVVSEISGLDGAPIETVALSPDEAARKAAFMLAKGLKATKRKT